MAASFVSNLIIYTSTNFEQIFVLEDTKSTSNGALNLENYILSSQFKRYQSSSVAGTFNVEITNAPLGVVKLSLTPNQTNVLKPGKYFYDLNATSPTGEKTRIVEGTLIVKKSVTR